MLVPEIDTDTARLVRNPGAPHAMQLIQDGTRITVDGYLGIITSHTKGL